MGVRPYDGSMHCPVCPSDDTKVIDSRVAEEGASIRRRRQCPLCGYRFTTRERLEEAPLMVTKRGGSRVPFDRSKLAAGPAPGQGGSFPERFSLGKVVASGRVVTMALKPVEGSFVLSDLSSGPVLFATC